MGFEIIFENLKETTDYVSIISLISSIISIIRSFVFDFELCNKNWNKGNKLVL